MPLDLNIVAKVNRSALTPEARQAIGDSGYVFSIYNNDIQLNPIKSMRVVENVEKLVQSVLMILLTKKGEHLTDPDYGTNIMDYVGEKLTSDAFAAIRDSIYAALAHYNVIATDNPNPDELIGLVNEVRVVRDDVDPRIVFVYIAITTQQGTNVNVAVMRSF